MRAEGYAVESICAVLREQGVQVAARTYRAWKSRLPALRTLEDARITDALRALLVPDGKGRPRPEVIYGRRKMTAWLRGGFSSFCRARDTKATMSGCSRSSEGSISLVSVPFLCAAIRSKRSEMAGVSSTPGPRALPVITKVRFKGVRQRHGIPSSCGNPLDCTTVCAAAAKDRTSTNCGPSAKFLHRKPQNIRKIGSSHIGHRLRATV